MTSKKSQLGKVAGTTQTVSQPGQIDALRLRINRKASAAQRYCKGRKGHSRGEKGAAKKPGISEGF